MSSSTKEAKVKELLARADEASTANETAKAATILREAVQLDADNPEVKKRWLSIVEKQDDNTRSIDTLRAYLSFGKDEDGKAALQGMRSKQLSAADTGNAFDLLVGVVAQDQSHHRAESMPARLDELFASLLDRHVEARMLLARRLTSAPTDIFNHLYTIGDDTFKAVMSVVLDTTPWIDPSKQVTAQQDIFKLCTATLIQAGVDRPERAMRAITHQLAVAPENVASLLDEDEIDIILSELDIRLDSSLRSQAMLATSQVLKVTKEEGEQVFADFVTRKVARQNNHDLILAFSAAAAVFPILPAAAAKLFLTEGFVQRLVPSLERNSDEAARGRKKSQTLEEAALQLLSAACVDKACRDAIKRYCTHWLQELSDERQGHHKALASLILAKISDTSVEDITTKLTGLVIHSGEARDQAIEGLAYTSLQSKMKERIADDTALLRSLVSALTQSKTAVFGCLTIFANLVAYKAPLSEEQKKMTQLHAYANSSKVAPDDPLEEDKHVTARCKRVLDANTVPALVAASQQSLSTSNTTLILSVLLSLSKDQKHRPKMAQQGAVRLLLQLRERTLHSSSPNPSATTTTTLSLTASHALSRLLISLNPSHLFSPTLPASTAVSALLPLLSADQSQSNDPGPRDLLPVFEALLALTNLASMPDDATPREQIIRTALPQIEDLLFSAHVFVQRASVELVCNLMASPSCIALFADSSSDSKRRLLILLALTDVADLASRRAAGGALAMMSEWDIAVTALLDVKEGKGMQALLGMCQDESMEVRMRGLVCLGNVVGAVGEVGERGQKAVLGAGGAERVREGLEGVKDGEVLAAGVEVLRLLA
ncbi:hypothetical protein LTR62_000584 [Meristemomyces frigidus]|uniref:UNC-45/Cro1/She4 central domain-containing protein n=1 Tax=Meristemomyces frigidus TaxID=1508187 RepID=A0AAN7TA92_9PEZI|nr:hypothetical protein LTR62_000584 [Meristemomyces frigidus]